MKYNYPLLGLTAALLFCGTARAQNSALDVESTSILYPTGRSFASPTAEVLQEDLKPFYHGVASGDPLSDRVIIWTRVTPDTLDDRDIEVSWRVSTDTALTQTVQTGVFTTSAERDFTVKVDVAGLEPGQTYYYGFSALDANSLTGRTKTTPTGQQVSQLKFGVVSCSDYQVGYFNAYGHLAARNDLDAVIHLGDYIYETAVEALDSSVIIGKRPVPQPIEVVTLFEYRTRYSTYRLDTQLMRVHQQHPFIAVWDDHEYAEDSNAGGARGHQPDEGDWLERKAQAKQAYFEWLPVREPGDRGIYRTIRYGGLADLIMLDTRIEARERQIYNVNDAALQAEDRTLLGSRQKSWLKEQISQSTARWKIIGQQVMFSPFNIGWAGLAIDRSFAETESLFLDIWDGYPAERQELIDFLKTEESGDVVILTGDFHSSLAFEVTDTPATVSFVNVPGIGTIPRYATGTDYDPVTGGGAVAVEFLTPSIASPNFDETVDPQSAAELSRQVNRPIRPNPLFDLGNPNPHLKYADLLSHGYVLLDVTEDGVQADYFYSDILEQGATEKFDTAMVNRWGDNLLRPSATPSSPKLIQDIPAPADPPTLSTSVREPSSIRMLSLYPNPATRTVYAQYGLSTPGTVRLRILDATGREVTTPRTERQRSGLYTFGLDVRSLARGVYYLEITGASGQAVQAFLRK